MSDEVPLRFPVEVVGAVDRIVSGARAQRGWFMHRRANRRGKRDLGLTDDGAWDVIAALTVADYHAGPEPDHHFADRQLWVFAPLVGTARAYLKVSFRPSDHPPDTTLVVWSIHPARFEMRRPYA